MNARQLPSFRLAGAAALALATLLLLPAGVGGQAAAPASTPTTPAANARAAALEARAFALFSQPRQWSLAAEQFEAAARQRSADDPRRVFDLMVAGRIYHAAGQLRPARRHLAAAAEGALQNGDILQAAGLFLDAAQVAEEQGDRAATRELARRAECLANSPLLTVAEAGAIRGRIVRVQDARYVAQ
jgi:tetratricopeptide (TPR) repeat protein